jgi:hypothetical protein
MCSGICPGCHELYSNEGETIPEHLERFIEDLGEDYYSMCMDCLQYWYEDEHPEGPNK